MLAINRLFVECCHLEYLYISEVATEADGSPSSSPRFRLPPQLRYLAIYDGSHYAQSILTEDNCKDVADTLRGLFIRQLPQSAPFPHLGLLTNLAYLGVEVTRQNEASILDALVFMPNLRALEMRGVDRVVLSTFFTHCPQLEHLSLTMVRYSEEVDVLHLMANALTKLLSLHVHHQRMTDWSWLQPVMERGRLEHLHLYTSYFNIPAQLVVDLVSNCKV